MFKTARIIIFLIFSILLNSCFKKDERIIIEERGSFFHISKPYNIRSFFSFIDLDSAKSVKTALISSWDLAFEGSETGWHIKVNAANSKEIFPTGSIDFSADYSAVNPPNWNFDVSSGNLDSTAVGKWVTGNPGNYEYTNQVYLLGKNNGDGTYLKLKKLKFIKLDSENYIFISADPGNSSGDSITITKNADYNYVYYSLDTPFETLIIEPPKDKWDFVACSYRSTLYTTTGIPTPYTVGGFLTNYPKVEVIKINKPDFFAASAADTLSLNFSKNQDAIGWDWKEYSSTGGSNPYRIVPDIYYFVRTKSGKLYKLEFTSYYSSENGENGYPTFRYLKLD
jgi:hypothetical protein